MNEIYEDAINYLKYYGEKNNRKIENIAYFLDCELKNYTKLQSNWNSLREYTEERLKVLERRINTFGTINPDKDTKVLQIYQNILDKMKKLESGDKN